MEAPFFKQLDIRLRKQVGASAKLIRLREEASSGSAQCDEVRSKTLLHFEVILSNRHQQAQGSWCIGPGEAQMDCTVLEPSQNRPSRWILPQCYKGHLPRYRVNLTFRVLELEFFLPWRGPPPESPPLSPHASSAYVPPLPWPFGWLWMPMLVERGGKTLKETVAIFQTSLCLITEHHSWSHLGASGSVTIINNLNLYITE